MLNHSAESVSVECVVSDCVNANCRLNRAIPKKSIKIAKPMAVISFFKEKMNGNTLRVCKANMVTEYDVKFFLVRVT